MSSTHDHQRAVFGKLALVLFVVGLPLLIAGLFQPSPWERAHGAGNMSLLAFELGFLVEIVALVFGINGRKYLYGKIGMYGAIVMLALVGVIVLFLLSLIKEAEDGQRRAAMTVQNSHPAPASNPSTATEYDSWKYLGLVRPPTSRPSKAP